MKHHIDVIDVVGRLRDIPPNEVAVLCDFDGTISVRDVQVLLLDRFARTDWREAERVILNQGKKSYHYLPSNWSNCAATATEVANYIEENAEVDPGFPPFVRECQDKGWYIEVVSDGLSIYIETLLKQKGIDIPFFSNRVNFMATGATYEFPNYNPKCGKCGSCKRSRLEAARDRGASYVIYAGDGISDECVAKDVDLLFAKDSLESYCKREGIAHVSFNSFYNISKYLEELFGNNSLAHY